MNGLHHNAKPSLHVLEKWSTAPLAGSENWDIENWELVSTNRLDEDGMLRGADRRTHGVASKDKNEAHQDVGLGHAL